MLAKLSKEAPNNPTDLARCTACGSVYPMQQTTDGTLYPAGTDGACDCGGDEFSLIRG